MRLRDRVADWFFWRWYEIKHLVNGDRYRYRIGRIDRLMEYPELRAARRAKIRIVMDDVGRRSIEIDDGEFTSKWANELKPKRTQATPCRPWGFRRSIRKVAQLRLRHAVVDLDPYKDRVLEVARISREARLMNGASGVRARIDGDKVVLTCEYDQSK